MKMTQMKAIRREGACRDGAAVYCAAIALKLAHIAVMRPMGINIDLFRLPADFTGEVRLFPLNEAVFFPYNVMPLHIFEDRYREMMDDALANDGLLTMATLEPGHGHDYYSRPPIDPHVCIGSVTSVERLEDGRYNFMLIGLRRARVEYEIEPVRSYRRARVTLVEDANAGAAELCEQQRDALAAKILEVRPDFQPVLDDLRTRQVSLDVFTDVLAFHLALTPAQKLKLLGEPDANQRARMMLADLAPNTSHERFGGFSEN